MDSGIEIILGKTLTRIDKTEDRIVFADSDGEEYVMYHDQDCCEGVSIDDIAGDLDDLIGSPILRAEESSNRDNPPTENTESHTWTFYHLATIKGYVTIRWYGESNGYYSESVSFCKLKDERNY